MNITKVLVAVRFWKGLLVLILETYYVLFNASCLLGEYFHVQFKQASNPRWQRSIMQFLFVGL